MRKTCQRRLQRRLVCCSVFLPRPAMTTRSSAGCRSVSVRLSRLEHPQAGVGVGRQRLSQAGPEVQPPGSSVEHWGRFPTARLGCFWPSPLPRGRALVDKSCICRRNGRMVRSGCAPGVPAEPREYQSKTELPLDYAGVWEAPSGEVAARFRFPYVADAVGGPGVLRGMYYVFDERPDTRCGRWHGRPGADPPCRVRASSGGPRRERAGGRWRRRYGAPDA